MLFRSQNPKTPKPQNPKTPEKAIKEEEIIINLKKKMPPIDINMIRPEKGKMHSEGRRGSRSGEEVRRKKIP